MGARRRRRRRRGRNENPIRFHPMRSIIPVCHCARPDRGPSGIWRRQQSTLKSSILSRIGPQADPDSGFRIQDSGFGHRDSGLRLISAAGPLNSSPERDELAGEPNGLGNRPAKRRAERQPAFQATSTSNGRLPSLRAQRGTKPEPVQRRQSAHRLIGPSAHRPSDRSIVIDWQGGRPSA